MKTVFFGTSNIALPVLEALSRRHEILAVVTRPDAPVGRKQSLQESPVSVLAGEMKLKILKPSAIKGNLEFKNELAALGADMFVVLSYGAILPQDIIYMPKFKTLCVHPSLLPKYRGPSPIQSALLNGDTETGTSIIVLDEQIDHGPLVAQKTVKIDRDDNNLSLSQKLAFASAELLLPAIDGFASGNILPKAQDESQATFCGHFGKQDGKIDWTKTSLEIYNQFRAFYPWPGIWTDWNGKKLKILDCVPAPFSETGEVPGRVGQGGLVFCGKNTALQIIALQAEGKNEAKIKDFLNGYPQFADSKL